MLPSSSPPAPVGWVSARLWALLDRSAASSSSPSECCPPFADQAGRSRCARILPMDRPTMFEFAGGEPAFLALAAAHHERCLQDPELNHPFSHGVNPEHIDRLAAYWAEVFGGPARFSELYGGHSAMLGLHAGQ